MTADKYKEMADNAAKLVNFVEDLQEKCKNGAEARDCVPLW